MTEMKETYFDTGTVRINYAEGPNSGPPLVLLHGGSAWWQDFSSIIPDLSANWHLFALDLRGHGKSGRVAQGYAIRDYAEDIYTFLKNISGRAILFGHSLGGMIALMVASHYPEMVRAVIVGDSPLDTKSFKKVRELGQERVRQWQALAGGSHPVQEIAAIVQDDYLAARLYHNDPEMIGMILDDFDDVVKGYEMETLLPSIRCPVLLLQADPDSGGVMLDAEVVRALSLLKKTSHVKFAGLSHMFFVENKEITLTAVGEFLAQIN